MADADRTVDQLVSIMFANGSFDNLRGRLYEPGRGEGSPSDGAN